MALQIAILMQLFTFYLQIVVCEIKRIREVMTVALVIGASGITGVNLIRHMHKDQKWTKIYAVTKTGNSTDLPTDSRVRNTPCDVYDLNQCQQQLGSLADVTNIFYVTWVKGDNEDSTFEINSRMFANILTISNSFKNLQHILLQTGLNYYGVHIGKNRVPCREDDPRVASKLFYYEQEDLLADKGKNATWTWNVVRPHDIIGVAGKENKMNLAQTLAVYATLCKERGEKFTFPGTVRSIDSRFDLTDVHILADFMLWLYTNRNSDQVKNRAFNCVNKDEQWFTWREMWYQIAAYFGLDATSSPNSRKLENEAKNRKQEWTNITEKYNLEKTDLDDVTSFWFVDQELSREWDAFASMRRAREAGYTRERDYLESFLRCFDKLQKMKIIPPTEEGKRRALQRDQKVKTTGKVTETQQPVKEALAAQ
jgi:nucleoside-diphosphate-sugar epimerase